MILPKLWWDARIQLKVWDINVAFTIYGHWELELSATTVKFCCFVLPIISEDYWNVVTIIELSIIIGMYLPVLGHFFW